MKLSKAVQKAMNDQINMELRSSYTYLAMSAWCEFQHYPGCAKWLRAQSGEENGHALRLYKYMADRNAKIEMAAIAAPPTSFKSLLEVFQQSVKAEEQVSESINTLYELCLKEKAFATAVELNWFLTEQVEEEKTARDLVAILERIEGDAAAIFDFDRQLGSRSSEEDGD